MELAYVFAISLQVCGAIILLINSLGSKEEEMDREIISNSGNNIETITYVDDIDLSEKLRDIYLNRTAFICLVFGYFLGVFGDIVTTPKWVIAIFILGVSSIITILLYCLCKKIADSSTRQCKYKENFKKKCRKNIV